MDDDRTNAGRELAKLGASKGGRARANVLTSEERSEIAREAARRRWVKAGKRAKKEASDDVLVDGQASDPGPSEKRPHSLLTGTLSIGNVSLECHVLSTYQRVLTQREMVRIISGGRESGNLQRYIERNPLTREGQFSLGHRIEFDVPGTGLIAHGYEATSLVELCERYLEARAQGLLKGRQLMLAKQAEIVMRASAKVGIIALIDEATGFQKIRRERELQLKFQAFIADDLQEWARVFPHEFWFELARLEGVRYSPRSRPLRWGKYVMAFVYDAIDKDIGRELRQKNPKPRYLRNHHQWLKEFGRQKVHDQVIRVVTIMKMCRDMDEFRQHFKRLFEKDKGQMGLFDWAE